MSKRLTDYFIKKGKPQQDIQNCESEKEKTDVEQPSSSLTEEPSTSNPSNEEYKQFQPPSNFSFPKSKVGTRTRSCHYHWFTKYQWLHYDRV